MIRWCIKYRGKMLGIMFKSKEAAEDYVMVGFEIYCDSLNSSGKHRYKKEYERKLDSYFHYEIVKCKIEVIE